MNFIRLAGGIAVLAAVFAASPAAAATATANVNVRNAPVNGAVVDVLRAGQQVDIDRCQAGWCYVVKPGPDGWVSAAYLSNDSRPPAPSRPDVDVSIGFSVPGFSIQIGNGGFDFRPNRPHRPTDRICFFENTGYRGDSFCARPGENLARLGRWNDRISSIRVYGDAQALVCERASFGGRCIVISRSVRDLGRRADNEISSIRVR